MAFLLLFISACSSGNADNGNNGVSNANSTSGSAAQGELRIVQETEHGLFYSPDPADGVRQSVATLAEAFEANYERITKLFQVEPTGKTIIHVYADKAQFREMIGRDTEGTYDAKEKVIKVYTPAALTDPEVEAEYVFQVVHEFVHAVVQQINPDIGNVKWLDEGIAYYASNQLEAELRIRSIFLDIPTLEQLADESYFDTAGGSAYFYSGTIIRYIVDEYGTTALNEIIRDPEQLERIVQDSTETIYEKWKADLQKT